MQCNASACMFTGAAKAVETYGDAIWEALCETFPCDYPFTLAEANDKLAQIFPLSPITRKQYIRAVIREVLAEGKVTGDPQIRRIGGKRYAV